MHKLLELMKKIHMFADVELKQIQCLRIVMIHPGKCRKSRLLNQLQNQKEMMGNLLIVVECLCCIE